MGRNPILTLACFFALALLYAGCDAFPETEPPDPDPPVQTEIVRIDVVPSPVAAGDTALFRAVIEDSLDERFTYGWGVSSGRFAGVEPRFSTVTIDTNSIRWVAPEEPGTYRCDVSISNGSRDSLGVGQSFDVTVVGRD